MRERAGLTRPQLASAAGVSAAIIEKIEIGTRRPGPGTLTALAAALRVAPGRLRRRLSAPARKEPRRPALAEAVRTGRKKANLTQARWPRRRGSPGVTCRTPRRGEARPVRARPVGPRWRAGAEVLSAREGCERMDAAGAGRVDSAGKEGSGTERLRSGREGGHDPEQLGGGGARAQGALAGAAGGACGDARAARLRGPGAAGQGMSGDALLSAWEVPEGAALGELVAAASVAGGTLRTWTSETSI